MRPGAFLLAVTLLVLAACSSVPDVVFVDEDAGSAEGGATSSSSGGAPPDAGPDGGRVPVASSDRGCIRKSGGEICCGSSICDDKRNCEGPGKVEQCTTCAYECPSQRCCVKGNVTTCAGVLLGDCPE